MANGTTPSSLKKFDHLICGKPLSLFARLATLKQVGKARMKLLKFLLPRFQFLDGHLLPSNRLQMILFSSFEATSETNYGCSTSALFLKCGNKRVACDGEASWEAVPRSRAWLVH